MTTIVEFNGIKLTAQDVAKVNAVKSDELDRLRKLITLYKIDDKTLAPFRLQACDMLLIITVRTVLKKKLRKEQQEWIELWMTDSNTMVKDYMSQLYSNISEFLK
mgnify:CR=1 FL=1|tara:strand:+ start:845 stop:1159 length:315 start_codon:yes stop_codon:yes gene_type:complete